MLADDLAWPELSSIGRGATRGNQGQKGVLGPPDNEGRSVLQLRVQPGVLAVRLNRQASDWYRTLDGEVNRALKLTKTYWRKARRRQDYDARADQDHMELHEWLQQLKDKAMSHLELLMQKGDIKGPPYTMPDDLELPFLRKFIERHERNIPHNPRLRNINARRDSQLPLPDETIESVSSEAPELGGVSDLEKVHSLKNVSEGPSSNIFSPGPSQHAEPYRNSSSYSVQNRDALLQTAHSSMQKLQDARNTLSVAQKDTQDAFRKYNTALEAERQARQHVTAAEKRRDDTMFLLLSHSQASTEVSSRQSSASLDEHQSPPGGHPESQKAAHQHPPEHRRPIEATRHNVDGASIPTWPDTDGSAIYPLEARSEFQFPDGGQSQAFETHPLTSRKHSREWDSSEQLQSMQPTSEDAAVFSPRKRVHQMAEGFEGLSSAAIASPGMSLPS